MATTTGHQHAFSSSHSEKDPIKQPDFGRPKMSSNDGRPEAPTDRLLAIARGVAAERDWPWLDPVEIDLEARSPEGPVWLVRTNCSRRGMNVRISIRESDFAVVTARFLPR